MQDSGGKTEIKEKVDKNMTNPKLHHLMLCGITTEQQEKSFSNHKIKWKVLIMLQLNHIKSSKI